MQNILTDNEHLVHLVTIHYGPGLSVDPAPRQTSHDWTTIERQLNMPKWPSKIVIDCWQDEVTKKHPLVPEGLTAHFAIKPEHDDRLHRATIMPTPGTVRFDNYTHPETMRLATSNFELYIKRGDQKWKPSIAATLGINLRTGNIVIF